MHRRWEELYEPEAPRREGTPSRWEGTARRWEGTAPQVGGASLVGRWEGTARELAAKVGGLGGVSWQLEGAGARRNYRWAGSPWSRERGRWARASRWGSPGGRVEVRGDTRGPPGHWRLRGPNRRLGARQFPQGSCPGGSRGPDAPAFPTACGSSSRWASPAGEDEAPASSPPGLWQHDEEADWGRGGHPGTLATAGAGLGAGREGAGEGQEGPGEAIRPWKPRCPGSPAEALVFGPLGEG